MDRHHAHTNMLNSMFVNLTRFFKAFWMCWLDVDVGSDNFYVLPNSFWSSVFLNSGSRMHVVATRRVATYWNVRWVPLSFCGCRRRSSDHRWFGCTIRERAPLSVEEGLDTVAWRTPVARPGKASGATNQDQGQKKQNLHGRRRRRWGAAPMGRYIRVGGTA